MRDIFLGNNFENSRSEMKTSRDNIFYKYLLEWLPAQAKNMDYNMLIEKYGRALEKLRKDDNPETKEKINQAIEHSIVYSIRELVRNNKSLSKEGIRGNYTKMYNAAIKLGYEWDEFVREKAGINNEEYHVERNRLLNADEIFKELCELGKKKTSLEDIVKDHDNLRRSADRVFSGFETVYDLANCVAGNPLLKAINPFRTNDLLRKYWKEFEVDEKKMFDIFDKGVASPVARHNGATENGQIREASRGLSTSRVYSMQIGDKRYNLNTNLVTGDKRKGTGYENPDKFNSVIDFRILDDEYNAVKSKGFYFMDQSLGRPLETYTVMIGWLKQAGFT